MAWSGHGTSTDPRGDVRGHEEIAAFVRAAHEQFPGFEFKLVGEHGGGARQHYPQRALRPTAGHPASRAGRGCRSGRLQAHDLAPDGEAFHPDWISRRFTRLVELSGLRPVRLHDLRHLANTPSLLAGNDIRVVQEKLGHSSRQITSDTSTSVLPEMTRAEAESVMAVVPRDLPFRVRIPLEIPETAWPGGIPVLFAHGARQPGEKRAVGAQTQPDTDLRGVVILAGRGQDDAANAKVKRIRDHRTAHDLELVRVENFNDRYPEDQRADFSLTHFTIARPVSPTLAGRALPTGLPPPASRTARRAPSRRRKAA
ncbi:tyrosine-type recombinase/integrase [Streptomyces sp. NPDC054783]